MGSPFFERGVELKHYTTAGIAALGWIALMGVPGLAGSSCCDTNAKAAATAKAKPAAAPIIQAKDTKPTAKPAPAEKEVKFTTNVKNAMAQAAKQKKLVMVDVYTDWCGWCKRLDKDVYTNQDVIGKVQKSFVALKVNPEKADKAFVDKYGVRGYPTILFLDAKGKEVHRIVGYKPAADFLKELDSAVSKSKSRTASAR